MAWLHVLWAAPAALGFAMLFNVRPRTLPLIALLAILARFTSEFIQHHDYSIVVADYAAAFLIGAIAYVVGPRTGEASPVYAFAPVIPLIPGAIIANALTSLVSWIGSQGADPVVNSEEFIRAAASGFTAAAILLALCLGAISPMLLLPRTRTAED